MSKAYNFENEGLEFVDNVKSLYELALSTGRELLNEPLNCIDIVDIEKMYNICKDKAIIKNNRSFNNEHMRLIKVYKSNENNKDKIAKTGSFPKENVSDIENTVDVSGLNTKANPENIGFFTKLFIDYYRKRIDCDERYPAQSVKICDNGKIKNKTSSLKDNKKTIKLTVHTKIYLLQHMMFNMNFLPKSIYLDMFRCSLKYVVLMVSPSLQETSECDIAATNMEF
ncbi:hypothetical protein AX774_g3129 [Zancudomyces culisetae]|uniref:Uncharacterized protein n=1 Tax=Zancudomyces culisetae TaxID=1213189 RepID=A0A1R1PQZ7_ZANCU|nr:hypothetical protein AX774_g3129 [Zancudomyces culisetae]|eukprot:OMH83369.1 hypothetical protein AX774_g3129 [Zancudomyces culisetae]